MIGCNKTDQAVNGFFKIAGSSNQSSLEKTVLDTTGKTIQTRIHCPDGYARLTQRAHSFSSFLSIFPLKKHGSKVYYFNGEEKYNQEVYAAVLDIDVGDKDLQQCADAVMRLRAEYLYKEKLYKKIHFNLTNGFRLDYSKWAEGYRVKVSGNNTTWYKSKAVDYSYATFREYMNFLFMYAGTLSLSKELKSIPYDSIQAGDVFIRGGSPGHAVIVMDVAIETKTGKRIIILAQSYMPAQNIHLLTNLEDKKLSPWYDLNDTEELHSPEWTFQKTELKRFTEE